MFGYSHRQNGSLRRLSEEQLSKPWLHSEKMTWNPRSWELYPVATTNLSSLGNGDRVASGPKYSSKLWYQLFPGGEEGPSFWVCKKYLGDYLKPKYLT